MALSHNNAFGLDISDAMLKLVWLDTEAHIRSFSAVPLAKGAMKDGRIADPALFKKGVRDLLEAAKGDKVTTPWVVASLPETHVFLKTLIMPKDERRGAEHFVFSRLSEHIPLSLKDVYVAWKGGGARDKSGAQRLMVAAAPREVVDEYDARLHEAGLKIEALQSESTAMTVALLKGWPVLERKEAKADLGVVLVNFKPDHAVIAFVDDGVILLSMTVQNGKLPIDDYIFRIEEKIEQGNAWRERGSGTRFKRIVVAGADEFQERLFADIRQKNAYRVEVGDPYANLCAKKDVRHEIHRLSNSYTTAIGLALGSR